MHLRTKLLLSYAFVIALSLALAALVGTVLLRRYQRDFTDQRVTAIAETTAIILHENNDPARFDAREELVQEANQTGTRLILASAVVRDPGPGRRAQVRAFDATVLEDTSGRLPAGSTLSLPADTYLAWRQRVAAGVETTTPTDQRPINARITLPPPLHQRLTLDNQGPVEVVMVPLRAETRTPGFRILIVTEGSTGVGHPLARLVRLLIWTAAVAFLVSSLVALVLARSITRPLVALTGATRALAGGDYSRRVPIAGQDEVAELGASFNALARDLERTRRRERDFLANISHDLKTPLTSIQGFAESLVDGTCPPEAYPAVARIIQQEAQRMNRLVGDVLQLSRLESGQLPLTLGPIDLAALLRESARRFASAAAAAGVDLRVTVAAEPAVSFSGDRARLEQVLGNLIDNALRHTPAGGQVELTGSLIAEGGDRLVRIVVRDTGSGIAAADLPRIFERFYQADKARASGGSGLGLAIVKELVELHGGRIEVASTVGAGTAITITLPAGHADDAPDAGMRSSGPRTLARH